MLTRTGRVVDQRRLLGHLDRLGRIGADDRGGVTRPGFGAADRDAHRYVAEQARALGLVSTVDAAGNLFVRRRHAEPDRQVLLIGSHLDSVTYGGRYDGTYGVVAALEVLATLADRPEPLAYEPVAVAFANEEGTRFPSPFFGSKAMVGAVDQPESIVDRDGCPLRDPLRAAGGDLDALPSAAWPAGRLAGFLELHVEQGPVLENAGVPVGVVDVVTGRTVFDIVLRGRQNHAGTTPMADRCDALVAAARVVLAIEDLARQRRLCSVATVGILAADPNVTNVVPGAVALTAEIRDGSAGRLAEAERAVSQILAGLDPRLRVSLDVTRLSAPVATAERFRSATAAAAADLQLPVMTLPSGAGHDAQIVAAAGPVGVMFVPSHDGISHAPQEFTAPADLVNGANVLLGTVMSLLDPP